MTLARWLPTTVLGTLLAYLVVVPIALLVYSGFKPTGFPTDPGFTFAHYHDVYLSPGFPRLFLNTVVFAVGSTILALAVSIGFAWLTERTDIPARNLFRALIILPMATPPILLAIAWTLLLDPRIGSVNVWLEHALHLTAAPFNVFTLPGIIFVEALSLVPTGYLILAAAFRNVDPSLEEAALVSGARPGAMLRRVVLPILAPAILAAGAFLLIATFVVFDVPGALGMPVRIFVLSTQIFFWYDLSTTGLPQYGNIAALATLFLAILALLGFSYQRMTRSAQRFVTITGKGFRVRRFPLGQWRPFALAGVVGYVICAVGAPLLLLLWTSLMPYETPVTLSAFHLITPANYLALISNVRFLEALRNSLVIAIVSASAVAALSAAVAWVVVRTHAIGRNIVDILAFAPIAVPGVMIGMALVVVYLTFHAVHVYGTIWIIAIAYVTTYLSYGSRAMRAAMLQIHPELEEAAQTSGARWLTVFRRITFPLTSTAFIAVWVWVLAHSMRELSSALMLHGESNTVLTTLLWDYWSGGEPTKAATVGVWLIVALFIAIYTWQKRETARS